MPSRSARIEGQNSLFLCCLITTDYCLCLCVGPKQSSSEHAVRESKKSLAVFTDCLPKSIKRGLDGSCTLSSLENWVRCAYYLPVAYVKRMALKAAERQEERIEHTTGWTWTMCHHLLKMGALYESGVQLEEFTLWRAKVLDFTNTTASTMTIPKGAPWKLMTSYEDQAVRCQLHIFELNP